MNALWLRSAILVVLSVIIAFAAFFVSDERQSFKDSLASLRASTLDKGEAVQRNRELMDNILREAKTEEDASKVKPIEQETERLVSELASVPDQASALTQDSIRRVEWSQTVRMVMWVVSIVFFLVGGRGFYVLNKQLNSQDARPI